LIVGNVPETFPIPDEQFGVKTPRNHRSGDDIVVAVRICSLRNVEELSALTRVPGSVKLSGKKRELERHLTYSKQFAQPP
jgi:hypothetical protein